MFPLGIWLGSIVTRLVASFRVLGPLSPDGSVIVPVAAQLVLIGTARDGNPVLGELLVERGKVGNIAQGDGDRPVGVLCDGECRRSAGER